MWIFLSLVHAPHLDKEIAQRNVAAVRLHIEMGGKGDRPKPTILRSRRPFPWRQLCRRVDYWSNNTRTALSAGHSEKVSPLFKLRPLAGDRQMGDPSFRSHVVVLLESRVSIFVLRSRNGPCSFSTAAEKSSDRSTPFWESNTTTSNPEVSTPSGNFSTAKIT
jgi:hypothetical protein